MIRNVSFVVIAKNEEFGVNKCLSSISKMQLNDCEIICVDSGSTDHTLDVMKAYADKIKNLRIIQCSGYLNSAVARNAGLKYTTKQHIFFVDGDVELSPDFISEALDRMKSGNADAVTGNLDEIVYSDGYKQIIKPRAYRTYYTRVMEISHCGGIFLVTRQLAEKVGPWEERMVRNQDIDFTLRISRNGRFLAIPISIGTHHTLSYSERPWLHIKKKFPMYFGMLIRNNLDRPKTVLSLLRQNRGHVAGFMVYGLFLVGILATAFLQLPFLYVVFAFSFMVVLDLFWGAVRKKNVFNRFLTHYLQVLLIVAGIFMSINNKQSPTIVKQISL